MVMLNKLKQMKDHFNQGKNAITFDTSRFNDPLADQIEWTPVGGGSSSFQSHKLVEVAPSRLEFQPTMKSKLFAYLFMVLGVGITGFFLFQALADPIQDELLMFIIPLLFGVVFAGAGYYILKKMSVPVVFDKVTGRFWRGKEDDTGRSDHPQLRNVSAIQLLSEYVRGNKNSYYIYEMNFVMADTKRLNLVRHGSKRGIRKDAEMLSKFIGKPVWDAAG